MDSSFVVSLKPYILFFSKSIKILNYFFPASYLVTEPKRDSVFHFIHETLPYIPPSSLPSASRFEKLNNQKRKRRNFFLKKL